MLTFFFPETFCGGVFLGGGGKHFSLIEGFFEGFVEFFGCFQKMEGAIFLEPAGSTGVKPDTVLHLLFFPEKYP